MNRSSFISFLLIAVFCSTSHGGEDVKELHPFVVLKGENSQINETCYLRITTLHEWLWIWLQHKPSVFKADKNHRQSYGTAWTYDLEELIPPGIPEVDFTQQMVIAIFLGDTSKVSGFKTEIFKTEQYIQFICNTTKDIESTRDSKSIYGFWVLPRIDKPLVIKEKGTDQTQIERKRFGKFRDYDKIKSLYGPKVLDLKEFLFKFQLEMFLKVEIESKRNQSSQNRANLRRVYFIDMGDKEDPSDEVMERFSGFGPIIKKYSDSTGYPEALGFVRDKKTQAPGVIIYARTLRWIEDNMAVVEYGYYMHGLGARKTIQLIEYKDESWILKEVLEGIVS